MHDNATKIICTLCSMYIICNVYVYVYKFNPRKSLAFSQCKKLLQRTFTKYELRERIKSMHKLLIVATHRKRPVVVHRLLMCNRRNRMEHRMRIEDMKSALYETFIYGFIHAE